MLDYQKLSKPELIEQLNRLTAKQQALEATEGLFQALTDTVPAFIWKSDAGYRWIYVTHSWLKFTGRTLDQELGHGWTEGIHPADRPCLEGLDSACEARRPFSIEYRQRCADGAYRWIVNKGRPAFNRGVFAGYVGACTDITERKQIEDTLRRAEDEVAFLGDLLEQSSQPLSVAYPDGRLGKFNRAFMELTGYGAEELQKIDWRRDLTAPDWRGSEQAKLDELCRTGQPVRYEKVYLRKDGSRIPVELLVHLVRDESGKPQYYYAFISDITERKQAEEELWQQRRFMRQVIDTDPNLIFVRDADGRFLLVNKALARLYGMTPEEMTGRTIHELNSRTKEVEQYEKVNREVIETRRQHVSVEFTSLGGQDRWYLSIKEPMEQPDGVVDLLGIAVDITERKLAEDKLGESYNQLQQLARHLETVREEEQRRIARELHDEFGGVFAALKFNISWLEQKLPPDGSLQQKVKATSALVDTGIRAMRSIVSQLRPSGLDDLGLVAALESYIDEFQERTGIECSLQNKDEDLRLDQDSGMAVFRIVQEALNNVFKHAQASKVNVALRKTAKSIVLQIKDNGKGFLLDDSALEGSYGLLGVRERAMMAGGLSRIRSEPGKGSRITVCIPYGRRDRRRRERRAPTNMPQ